MTSPKTSNPRRPASPGAAALEILAARGPRRHAAAAVMAMAACVAFGWAAAAEAASSSAAPPPATDLATQAPTETLVLAGGNFWGVQGVFQRVQGVSSAVSGYTGGDASTAKYQSVGTGTTGHAESVRITFDPKKVSFGRLLQIYFSVAHDPTELNRPGPDTRPGPQYRSAIFPANAEQARVARSYIAQLNRANTFGRPLATTVEPLKAFYPAESQHQDFLTRHPNHPYVAVNDMPKIDELKRLFPTAYQSRPVLVGRAGVPN